MSESSPSPIKEIELTTSGSLTTHQLREKTEGALRKFKNFQIRPWSNASPRTAKLTIDLLRNDEEFCNRLAYTLFQALAAEGINCEMNFGSLVNTQPAPKPIAPAPPKAETRQKARSVFNPAISKYWNRKG